jgi:thioesterase domain-containing protein
LEAALGENLHSLCEMIPSREIAEMQLERAGSARRGLAAEKPSVNVWGGIRALLALRDLTPPLTHLEQNQNQAPPLSFAQERVWSLERSEPGTPCYHVSLAWNIQGEINIQALERSLDFLVQRHEALRTTFPDSATGPAQRINAWHLELPVVEMPSACRPAGDEVLRHAREFARQPIALESGPLTRAVLYRSGAGEHLLVFVVHQIVFDGASLRVLSGELAACYRAFAAGAAPALDPLRVSYGDFARWQRSCLTTEILERMTRFWRGQFQTPYEPLQLPTDHPGQSSGIPSGSSLSLKLPKPLIDGLKHVSQQRGVTTFAALLGSWQASLSLCTRQKDILALATVAARNQPELKNLIGLVANVLPMRLDLTGHPSLRQVLDRAGEMVSNVLAHQILPLDRILELLPPRGRIAEAPALQLMMLYNNSPLPILRFPKATFTPRWDVDHATASFDLLLDVADSPQGVTGYLKYRADLFKQATIERLIQHWASFIEQAVAEPEQPIDNLSLPSLSFEDSAARAGFHRKRASEPASASQPSSSGKPAFVPPRNECEEKLVRIWETVFGLHPIGIDDHFFALGGHSLLGVKLIAAMEKETGLKLRLGMIFQLPTIARLAQALQQRSTPARSSLIEIQPRGAKPALFLVHGAGGGMLWGYNNLARQLGEDQPVYSFRSQGLDGPEPLTRIEGLATQYVADLRRFHPRGPYILGGFCFGGNIAYEMACQLVSQGEQVAGLFLINCWANGSSYTRFRWTPGLLSKALGNFCLRLGHQIRWGTRNPLAFVRWYTPWVGRRLKALFSREAPAQIDLSDFVDLSQQPEPERQLWRTHVQAWLQYRPRPYAGRLVLLRTRGHPLRCSYDPQMGWGDLALGGVLVKTCPGDHSNILDEENVIETARQLNTALAEAQAGRLPAVSREKAIDCSSLVLQK